LYRWNRSTVRRFIPRAASVSPCWWWTMPPP